MTTHAHYAGEFGAQKMTKKLEKDPAYRAARAEHYANEAKSASLQHAMSLQLGKKADAAEHALVAAHAEKRTKAHAAAAQKLAPDSEHATNAAAAHESARDSNAEIRARESGPKVKLSYVPGETAKALLEPIKDAVAATKAAFALTKKASDNPTVKTQMAASKAHEYAAKMSVGHDKNVALHTRMADHHRNRAETIPLDGTKVKSVLPDNKQLAEIIHNTTGKIGPEGRFGDRKVFSHEVYNAMSVQDKTKFGTIDQFKDKVRELHKTQLLVTSRADLVAAMNPIQVKSSHINMEDVGHHGSVPGVPHANFINTDPLKN